jgi:hypothetical protein
MSSFEFAETPDRWGLALESHAVVQCRVDYAFTLVIDGPSDGLEVRIQQPFELLSGADGETPVRIDPNGDPSGLVPALGLWRAELVEALAFKDGRLELRFAEGERLHVPAGEKFEPWTLVGPAELRLVSMPGGDLAVWKPELNDSPSV